MESINIYFSRKLLSFINKFFLNGIELDLVNHVKDLVIIYVDSSHSINDHLIYIQSKASSLLGFIIRSCNNFNNPIALKSLYCAFVRSALDYNSVIWSPYTSGLLK